MKKLFASILMYGFFGLGSPSLFAHEGHDETPGQLRSQFGGVVKGGKQLNIELVTEGNKINVYPLAHGSEMINPVELKVNASAKAPKGALSSLKLTPKNKGYEGEVDFKNASRLELEVKTVYQGKSDSFKFQVEKQ